MIAIMKAMVRICHSCMYLDSLVSMASRISNDTAPRNVWQTIRKRSRARD